MSKLCRVVFTNKLTIFTLVAFPAGSPSGDVCEHRRANQPEVGQFIGAGELE